MMDWSIWTFCYAEGRLPLDFVRGTPVASNLGHVEVPMIFSLLQSTDGTRVLVDTGFSDGVSMTGPVGEIGRRVAMRLVLVLRDFGGRGARQSLPGRAKFLTPVP